MSVRIAAASSLLVFAVAVICGLVADNTFVTTVSRGLYAMAGTFGIGLIVGAMANAMADEREKALLLKKKEEISEPQSAPTAESESGLAVREHPTRPVPFRG